MAKKAASAAPKIVPLGDRVVLKREDASSTTAGGSCCPTPPRTSRNVGP